MVRFVTNLNSKLPREGRETVKYVAGPALRTTYTNRVVRGHARR